MPRARLNRALVHKTIFHFCSEWNLCEFRWAVFTLEVSNKNGTEQAVFRIKPTNVPVQASGSGQGLPVKSLALRFHSLLWKNPTLRGPLSCHSWAKQAEALVRSLNNLQGQGRGFASPPAVLRAVVLRLAAVPSHTQGTLQCRDLNQGWLHTGQVL